MRQPSLAVGRVEHPPVQHELVQLAGRRLDERRRARGRAEPHRRRGAERAAVARQVEVDLVGGRRDDGGTGLGFAAGEIGPGHGTSVVACGFESSLQSVDRASSRRADAAATRPARRAPARRARGRCPRAARRRGGAAQARRGARRARHGVASASARVASGDGYRPVDRASRRSRSCAPPRSARASSKYRSTNALEQGTGRSRGGSPAPSARTIGVRRGVDVDERRPGALLALERRDRGARVRGGLLARRGVVAREALVDLGVAGATGGHERDRAAPSARSVSISRPSRVACRRRARRARRRASRPRAMAAKFITNWNCASLPASASCASVQSRRRPGSRVVGPPLGRDVRARREHAAGRARAQRRRLGLARDVARARDPRSRARGSRRRASHPTPSPTRGRGRAGR